MKALWVLSVLVVALLSIAVVRAAPAGACSSGCSMATGDQTDPTAAGAPSSSAPSTAVTNPTPGTMVTETITPGRTRADFPSVTIVIHGQYCADKSGGVIFVPSGSPTPDGVTC